MQKITTHLKLGFILLLVVAVMGSCSKSSSSTAALVGDWARGSEFDGVARTEAVTFTIGSIVYVGGGFDGTNRLNDFWKYNATTKTWLRIADFPGTARNSAVAFAAGGMGYVGTGFDGLNKLNDFWQYNPATNTWAQVANFGGTARYGAVAFSINDIGYVTTGFDGNYLKDLWKYTPSSNTWTQVSSLAGSKRKDASVFVYGGKAYVVCGVNNGTYVDDFWVYDAPTDTWTAKRQITNVSTDTYDDLYGTNITRSNAAIFIMGSKAYLAAGNRNGVIGTCWAYDITSDTWAEKTAFEGPVREGCLGFTINDQGYLATGNNSTTYFDDLWQFFPDAAVNPNNN